MLDLQNASLLQKRKPVQNLIKMIASRPELDSWLTLAPYWDDDMVSVGIVSDDYLFYFSSFGRGEWLVDIEDFKTGNEHSPGRILFSGSVKTKSVLAFLEKWQEAPLPMQRIKIDEMLIENWHVLFEDWFAGEILDLLEQEVQFEISSLPDGNKIIRLRTGELSGSLEFFFEKKLIRMEVDGGIQETSISADPLNSFDTALGNMKWDYFNLEFPEAQIGSRIIREEISYFSTIETPYGDALVSETLMFDIEKRIDYIHENMLPVTDTEAEMLLDFLKSDLFSVWNTFFWAITSAPGWPFNEKLLLRFDPMNTPLVELQLESLGTGGRVRTSPRLPVYLPAADPTRYLREIKGPLAPEEANLVLVILHGYPTQITEEARRKAYSVIVDSGFTMDFVNLYGNAVLIDEVAELAKAIRERKNEAAS